MGTTKNPHLLVPNVHDHGSQTHTVIGHESLDSTIAPGIRVRRIFRPREYKGHTRHVYERGKPPLRLYQMQNAHQGRARAAGVLWEIVDFRDLYEARKGICGICCEPVGFHDFTVDHVLPLVLGGPHLFENLQLAHKDCNTKKGAKHVRPRGRPKEFDSVVSVRLPAFLHEAIVLRALERRVDVSDVIRECLETFVFQK